MRRGKGKRGKRKKGRGESTGTFFLPRSLEVITIDFSAREKSEEKAHLFTLPLPLPISSLPP